MSGMYAKYCKAKCNTPLLFFIFVSLIVVPSNIIHHGGYPQPAYNVEHAFYSVTPKSACAAPRSPFGFMRRTCLVQPDRKEFGLTVRLRITSYIWDYYTFLLVLENLTG